VPQSALPLRNAEIAAVVGFQQGLKAPLISISRGVFTLMTNLAPMLLPLRFEEEELLLRILHAGRITTAATLKKQSWSLKIPHYLN
jgi:hypothetical protein